MEPLPPTPGLPPPPTRPPSRPADPRAGTGRAVRNVLDGMESIYLGVCFLVLAVLVVLRGFSSAYRVGSFGLLALAVLGFLFVSAVVIGALLGRRGSRVSLLVGGGYVAAMVAIIAVDLATN